MRHILKVRRIIFSIVLVFSLCMVLPDIIPGTYNVQASTTVIVYRWRLTVRSRTSVSTSKKKQTSFSMQSDLSIPLNKKTKLKVKKLKNAKKVKWAVSDPSILKMKKKRKYTLITGINPGVAVVKATAKNYSQYCLVVVGDGEYMSQETKLWMKDAYMDFGGIYPQTNSVNLNEGERVDIPIHYNGIGYIDRVMSDLGSAVLTDILPSGDTTLRISAPDNLYSDINYKVFIQDTQSNSAEVSVHVKASPTVYQISTTDKEVDIKYNVNRGGTGAYIKQTISCSITSNKRISESPVANAKSSNNSIVTVNRCLSLGNNYFELTGHAPGKAIITLSYKNASTTIPVTVGPKNNYVIRPQKTSYSIYKGDSASVTATITDKEGLTPVDCFPTVTASSSNPSVVSITNVRQDRYNTDSVNVWFKAHSIGSAIITLRCGGKSIAIPITVSDSTYSLVPRPEDSVSLSIETYNPSAAKTNITFLLYRNAQLYFGNITYSVESSDPECVDVSVSPTSKAVFIVTAKKTGSAIITATATDQTGVLATTQLPVYVN